MADIFQLITLSEDAAIFYTTRDSKDFQIAKFSLYLGVLIIAGYSMVTLTLVAFKEKWFFFSIAHFIFMV